MTIPNPEISATENPFDILAESPQSDEAPEAKSVLISFARYNEKECQINEMDGKVAKKSLRTIRDIGVAVKTWLDFKTALPNLRVEPVVNAGAYKSLYRGLKDLPDVQVQEAKIDRAEARLFFFMVESRFYVIAVRRSHYAI